jgi:uncharacterized protein (DUF4415 family)
MKLRLEPDVIDRSPADGLSRQVLMSEALRKAAGL